jgi:hypothetical protein
MTYKISTPAVRVSARLLPGFSCNAINSALKLHRDFTTARQAK